MIEYLEIVNKIKNVKEESIEDFNRTVSIPLILSNQECFIKQIDNNIIIEKNGKSFELTIEDRQAFSEVIFIFKNMDKDLYDKVDYKYVDFFEKFKDINYNLEYNGRLEEIELKKLTLEILTILNLKFWCIDDADRKGFLENLKERIIKPEESEEVVVEEKNIEEIEDENLEMIKNTWWMNLLNKLRDIKKNMKK